MGAISLTGGDPTLTAAALGASMIGPVVKFSVVFPVAYHYIAGVRHYMWDKKPETLTNDQCEQSSKIIMPAGVAIGVIGALL